LDEHCIDIKLNAEKIVTLRNTKVINLRFEYFIAKRLIGSKNKDSISRPIVKIAVGSVVLSIVIMLMAVMAGKGMQKKIREKISSFTGHIVLLNYDNNQSQITLQPLSLRQDFYPDYSRWKEVESLVPYATIGGILKTGADFEGIIFKGVDSTYHWKIFREYMLEGKIPTFGGRKPSDSILISQTIAKRLHLRAGSRVKGYFMRPGSEKPLIRRFTVAGIYKTDFEDYDKTYVFGDLRQVKRLYGWNDTLTGGFEILIKDFDRIDQVTAGINDDLPPLIEARSIKDLNPLMFDWLAMFDFNMLFIIIILIIVSALNMTTVLLVLIMEKTRFIGTLKTLGATDRSIGKIFLLKAAWLISAGLLIGNIIVLVLYMMQKKYGFIKLNPDIYYVKEAVFDIGWVELTVLNVSVLVLILILLLLPARSIGRISPGKVLKFE
jgi:lipoprotein-releasing system permease protein